MPKPQQDFYQSIDSRGEEVAPGVFERVLAYDPETGNVTKTQTILADVKVGDTSYCHPDYWEEIFVVKGTAYCGTVRRWLKVGDYACRAPGMVHGPFHTGPNDGEFVTLLVNTYNWKDPQVNGK